MEALKVSAKPDALIGQLRVMAATEQNEILRDYLQQAVAALDSKRGAELANLAELAAALDMMSDKTWRKEAEVLRSAVEYLEELNRVMQS